MYPNAGTQDPPPAVREAVRQVRRRQLALLAAILYNPVILVAYLLYTYGPSRACVAGPLCSFGAYPGVFQVLLVLVGAALAWLLLAVVIRRALEAPGRQGPVARALYALSDFGALRELLGIYSVLLLLGIIFALLGHRLTPTAAIVAVFTVVVSLRCALVADPPAAPPAPEGDVRQSRWLL